MSRQVQFSRGQRQWRTKPTDEVVVPNYPQEPSPPSKMSWWLMIAPVGGVVLMSVAFGFLYKNFIYPLVISSVSMVYPLVMLLRQREQFKRWREKTSLIQEAYKKRISEVEQELSRRREQQAEFLQSTFPAPEEILNWAQKRSDRLWERRPYDQDFLEFRVGTGEVRSSYRIKIPHVDIPELAPPQLLEARKMAEAYRKVHRAPITFNLGQNGSLAITGPRVLRESVVRTILTGLAGLHAPNEVELYAIYPAKQAAEWTWLKWLPHTYAMQTGGGRQHIAYEPGTIRQVLSGLLDELHTRGIKKSESQEDISGHDPFLMLLVVDYEAVRGETTVHRILERGSDLGAGLILLTPSSRDVPEGCGGWIELVNEKKGTIFKGDEAVPNTFVPEVTDLALVEKLARNLAPIELVDIQAMGDLPDEIRLLDLVGCADLESLDIESRWLEASSHSPSLNVPIGMRHGKRPLLIDLKQSGHGPHGLIAGTTGSGKSELLLTLLTGLALSHHPHQINFILVDYKGGTAMSVLADLPHTVGVVTDLDGKQTRRALVALRSEMTRREEILARYQVADIYKYHELGISEPFPYLFIVIDEFAELREHFKYDLADILREFVSIAQKGRALGVHLILAMQKPEGVVNDSIRANMKYRICLRVERAEDSRNVLRRPDAYLLPNHPPGRAYFQVGNNEEFDLFQVARVAGFHRPVGPIARVHQPLVIHEVAPDGRRITLLEIEVAEEPEPEQPSGVRTEAQIIVDKAAAAAQRMGIEKLPSPWPAPLPEAITLDVLFDRMTRASWDGEVWPAYSTNEDIGWQAPIALLDEPIHQRQIPLVMDLAKDGNLLVVGAPGSGRTTCLLTLLTSLARLYPPDLIHFHLVDFSGHQLQAAFSNFPHVAGTYRPGEEERIRRLQSTLNMELEKRKDKFAQAGVVNLGGYRRFASDVNPLPALLIVFNNFSGFRESFIDEMTGWIRLLREGNAYGLYFALTSDRLPTTRVADLMQTRIALRISDKAMYSVILDARPDLTTYDPIPGRGFLGSKPPIETQIALPMDGFPDEQISALQDLGMRMDRAWKGLRPQTVRLLSEQVSLAEVMPEGVLESRRDEEGLVTWIGLDNIDLKPVPLDLSKVGSYLLVTGPPESGKTTALACIGLGLAATHSPTSLRLALVTPNRGERYSLDPLANLPHTLKQAKTKRSFETLLSALEVAAEAREEIEGDGQAGQSHIVLLIDDYYLLVNRMPSAMVERLELLARRGVDLGITTIASVPTTLLSGVPDALLRQMKAWRNGLWLKSTEGTEASMVGAHIPINLRRKVLPAGRGILYNPSGQVLLQVASPEFELDTEDEMPKTLEEWVQAIRARESKSE